MMHVMTPYGRRGPSSRVRVFEWLDRIAVPSVLSSYISYHKASPSEIASSEFSTRIAAATADRVIAGNTVLAKRVDAHNRDVVVIPSCVAPESYRRKTDPYTRGKCGYKILQYAAAGTPAIASPVGVNRRILSELGLPAAEASTWTDAILELLEASTVARAARGRHAR